MNVRLIVEGVMQALYAIILTAHMNVINAPQDILQMQAFWNVSVCILPSGFTITFSTRYQ